jgi:hypothetical protein
VGCTLAGLQAARPAVRQPTSFEGTVSALHHLSSLGNYILVQGQLAAGPAGSTEQAVSLVPAALAVVGSPVFSPKPQANNHKSSDPSKYNVVISCDMLPRGRQAIDRAGMVTNAVHMLPHPSSGVALAARASCSSPPRATLRHIAVVVVELLQVCEPSVP